MFRAMIPDEGCSCLTYVQEADKINIQANYRRDEVYHLHPSIGRRGKRGVMGIRVRVVENAPNFNSSPVEGNKLKQTLCYIFDINAPF